MAGNKITWNIGYYDPDTHYVYRSDAPMDSDNLPTPLATLGQGVSVYNDTDGIVEETTYYYRVDAEKMGLTIPGYEIELYSYPSTAEIHDIFGDNSIIATYNLNGDATDLGGNNGTWSGTEQYENATIRQAARFNGSSKIDTLTTDFDALSIWINMDSDVGSEDNGRYIFGFDNSNIVNLGGFSSDYAGESLTIYNGGGASNGSFSKDIPFEQYKNWTHIVIQWTGSGYEFYVDKNKLSMYINNAPELESTLIRLGKREGYNQYFKGLMSQLRVFNRPLTQEEVNILYLEGEGLQ